MPAQCREAPTVEELPSGPRLFRWDGEIFTCAVTLLSVGRPMTPFPDVIAELRNLGRRFSRFAPDSELSRFNAASDGWRDVSHRLHRLLRAALDAAAASDGLVNAAILPALRAAGYESSWPFTVPGPVPRPIAGEPVPQLHEVLAIRPGQARLMPGCAVDVGGLAKGIWADESWTGSAAMPSAVWAGTWRVVAARRTRTVEGWPIIVTGGQRFLVHNAGVATSGVGRRTWGTARHHIIDPRSGLPSSSNVRTASVLAPSAGEAEWMATSVVVGGTSVAERLAIRRPHLDITLERTDVTHDRAQ